MLFLKFVYIISARSASNDALMNRCASQRSARWIVVGLALLWAKMKSGQVLEGELFASARARGNLCSFRNPIRGSSS